MRASAGLTQQDVEKVVAASTRVLSDRIKELEAELEKVQNDRDTWNQYAYEATLSEERNRETIRRLVVVCRAMDGVGLMGWSKETWTDWVSQNIKRALAGEGKRNDTN